jgi:hypothetical protein
MLEDPAVCERRREAFNGKKKKGDPQGGMTTFFLIILFHTLSPSSPRYGFQKEASILIPSPTVELSHLRS